MTFAHLAYGTAVFLDANIVVYHFGPHATFASACTDLLERINRQELQGFTCARVLSDVAHRLMTLEACAVLKRAFPGIGNYLRKHPPPSGNCPVSARQLWTFPASVSGSCRRHLRRWKRPRP